MRINGINNFNNKTVQSGFMGNSFKLPQIKNFEGNSLELLGNYNVFKISFRGEENQRENRIKSALKSSGKFEKNKIEALSLNILRGNDKISQIKEELALELCSNEKFSGEDIEKIIFDIRDVNEIAKIQKELVLELAENKKFSGSDIKDVNSHIAIRSDILASIQKELALEFAQEKNFSPEDVSNVISNARLYDGEFSFYQKDFISELKEKGLLDYKNLSGSFGSFMLDVHSDKSYKEKLNFIFNAEEAGLLDDESILKKDSKSLYILSKYAEKYPEINSKEFFSYFNKIDFKKLGEISPLAYNFSFDECLKFAVYHFKNDGKIKFSMKDLIFDEDLNEFLSENYLDADSLTDLFSAFPLTKREVGEMPPNWLKDVPIEKREEAEGEIYGAIKDFIKDKNISSLSFKLSEIAGREVTVQFIDKGTYGTGYKISTEGSPDVCLKVFDQCMVKPTSPTFNEHGQHIEVQTGLFANRYVKNYVKMYFGYVSPYDKTDGFLVTQFLDEDITLDDSVGKNEGQYVMNSTDTIGDHNKIKGVIFDYGATYIRENKTGKILDSYDFINS